MSCVKCGSDNEKKFVAEVTVHSPGLKNLDEPGVLMFPKLRVCLNCGFAQFTLPTTALHVLTKSAAA
jgi:hypothetical protein